MRRDPLPHEPVLRNELALRREQALLREPPDELLRRVRPGELPRRVQPDGRLRRVLLPGHALPVNAAESKDGFQHAPRVWPQLPHG